MGPNGTGWTVGQSEKLPVKFIEVLQFVADLESIFSGGLILRCVTTDLDNKRNEIVTDFARY